MGAPRGMLFGASKQITPTTWNPSDKGANVTLSGGNLVMSSTGAGGAIRSIASRSSGKSYWEITCTSGGGSMYVGGGNGSFTFGVSLGVPGAFGYNSNGGLVFIDGSNVDTYSTWAGSDIISLALDANGAKIWFRKNGGNWNNSGAADPAAGSGGLSVSAITGPYFAAATINAGQQLTANFGATAFTYAVPSGFAAGFGT